MSSMVTANAQFFKLAFHTAIVEYNIIHSGIRNYTKLACNNFKMIQNDVSQTGDLFIYLFKHIYTGQYDDRPLT